MDGHSSQSLAAPSALAARLMALQQSEEALAAAQRTNAVAIAAFRDEVNSISGQQDPLIWEKVQRELEAHREQGNPSFARGHFAGFTMQQNAPLDEGEFTIGEEFNDASTWPAVFDDSPLFGAVDALGSTNAFGAALPPLDSLPPLDGIPPLPALPSDNTIDPSFLLNQGVAHYPQSNSSCSSGPSPSLSPWLSPYAPYPDLSFASGSVDPLNSPYSSPPPPHGFPASMGADTPLLAGPCPPQADSSLPLFAAASPNSFAAQLQQILDSSVASSGPARQTSPALTRTSSSSGRAPRRGSSGREAPRFNPMASTSNSHSRSTSYSENLSRSLPIAIAGAGSASQGVANIALQMSTLSTSPVPTSPHLSPRDGLSRAGSARRQRAPRPMVYNESVAASVAKNQHHLFAVHTQSKTKVDVSEASVTPIILSDETSANLPLARCVNSGIEYSSALFREDCQQRNSYLFHSQDGAINYSVNFSQFGPRILPSSPPRSSGGTESTPTPIYTFIHFAPGDIVVTPSLPLASRGWWRLQECQQVHPGFPYSDGHWTCRFDGEGQEKRRPVRVISHFASCPSSKTNEFGTEASWSLGRLAKAILEVLPASGS
ncbi:hypothetical protein BCR35DRAFT_309427 [Leucosporidium creatinivorum]|uniref:Uncharacterized protein n=1 Tax=Leucosporidium creatinivorum TaxID=106004 RepID=A0A1Y2DHF5_9BASI|nr:hypothetical protein BCR35DRAFT_309427 [Leucosporidium creatinivorum]